MELDDLKEAWTALDNRLKRTEQLKESIILEMMQSKAGKLVNGFIIWEIFQAVIVLLCIPLVISQLDRFAGKYLTINITLIFAIAICIIGFFWGIYKLNGLMKIDVLKNIGNNIFYVNKYRIQLKREKQTGYFLLPATMMLMALSYASIKVSMSLWVLMTCGFIAITLIIYWSYKFYNKNIDSILKSLDEIHELKE